MDEIDRLLDSVGTAQGMIARDQAGRLAFNELELAKFVIEMKYRYGKTEKEVMDDIENVMKKYGFKKGGN